jgi:hypothetical protein
VFDKLNARTPIVPVVIFRQLMHGEGTDKLITRATENQLDGLPVEVSATAGVYPPIPLI